MPPHPPTHSDLAVGAGIRYATASGDECVLSVAYGGRTARTCLFMAGVLGCPTKVRHSSYTMYHVCALGRCRRGGWGGCHARKSCVRTVCIGMAVGRQAVGRQAVCEVGGCRSFF